jgi:hypothetical protein
MQKNKLIQMAVAAILAVMMAGCGAPKDEIPAMQQESDAETNTEIKNIEPESINIEIEEPQTGTETESNTQMDTGRGSAPETDLQAGSQEETELHKTEDRPELEKSEIETQIQPIDVSEPQTEIKSNTETQQPAAEGSVSASDYTVSVRGTAVALQADMRDLVSALGDPDGYSAAKSCVEAGEDKIYIYGGITIYTYVTNGADRITLIEITGSELLPSGIHIGSTKADVIAAYGSGYMEEGTELLYEADGKTLGLQMEGDAVSFIELFGR